MGANKRGDCHIAAYVRTHVGRWVTHTHATRVTTFGGPTFEPECVNEAGVREGEPMIERSRKVHVARFACRWMCA